MSLKKRVKLVLNGKPVEAEVEPDEKLAVFLRRQGCRSVKVGCDEGVCGSCTVILDGRAVNSCHLFVLQAQGRNIRTVECLGTFDAPHPLQVALADEGAVQCGFCTPGVLMSAIALYERNPNPSEEELLAHFDGNLCRCTGYEKIQTALRKYTAAKAGGGAA